MIAQAAGVAVGSLYRYYANKEELVTRLYAENFGALAWELDAAQAEAGTARDKIAAMVGFICGYFEREWDRARFLLLEQHIRLKGYAGSANPVDIVHRVVAEGICRGEIRPLDPMLATALVMGPVIQAATFRTYGRLNGSLAAAAADIAQAVWSAIAPEETNR